MEEIWECVCGGVKVFEWFEMVIIDCEGDVVVKVCCEVYICEKKWVMVFFWF